MIAIRIIALVMITHSCGAAITEFAQHFVGVGACFKIR